jgi:hypothetical protein
MVGGTGQRGWVVGIDEMDEMDEIYPPSRHQGGKPAIPSSTIYEQR